MDSLGIWDDDFIVQKPRLDKLSYVDRYRASILRLINSQVGYILLPSIRVIHLND